MSTGLLGEDVVALQTEKQDETHLSSVPTTSATHSDHSRIVGTGGEGRRRLTSFELFHSYLVLAHE